MESIIETMGLKATATSAIASNATPIAGTDMSKSEDRTAVYASQQHPSVAAPIGRRWSEAQYIDLCKRVDAEHEYRQVLADNWRDEEILNCLPDVERADGKVPESTIYAYAEHRDIPRSVVDDVLRKYAPTAEQQRELARHSNPSQHVLLQEIATGLSIVCDDAAVRDGCTLAHTTTLYPYLGNMYLTFTLSRRRSFFSKEKVLTLIYKSFYPAVRGEEKIARVSSDNVYVHSPLAFTLFGKSLERLCIDGSPSLAPIERAYTIRPDGKIVSLSC